MVQQPKKILVTGAAGALGQIVVKKFLSQNLEVIATDIKTPLGTKNFEGVDTLVHCAGGFRFSLLEETSQDDFEFLLDSNFKSAFNLLKELLPGMKKRNFGRIVLVSAKSTLNPPAGMSAYAATKAGINALVTSVAEEVKPFNININAVMPSIIDTPSNRQSMPKADFSKWVNPNDLAEIIFSLTQAWGNPIHGALIPVAGRI